MVLDVAWMVRIVVLRVFAWSKYGGSCVCCCCRFMVKVNMKWKEFDRIVLNELLWWGKTSESVWYLWRRRNMFCVMWSEWLLLLMNLVESGWSFKVWFIWYVCKSFVGVNHGDLNGNENVAGRLYFERKMVFEEEFFYVLWVKMYCCFGLVVGRWRKDIAWKVFVEYVQWMEMQKTWVFFILTLEMRDIREAPIFFLLCVGQWLDLYTTHFRVSFFYFQQCPWTDLNLKMN